MKVLIIGSGGREHALVWKVSQSPNVSGVYCIPGNGGIRAIAQSADIDIRDFKMLSEFVKKNSIGLTIVGPEIPLTEGIVDYFQEKGLAIFGPDKKSAQLEGSKVFSKRFMKKYGIPTAEFEVFSNPQSALKYIDSKSQKNCSGVVKADGLAAGKGVVICDSKEELTEAVNRMMVKKEFGSAGENIVIESKLKGEEASMMAFCDGETVLPMLSSQDHKQIYDGDKGPNTGGLGAYAPAPVVTDRIYNKVKTAVFERFLKGIKEEKINFKGVIYAGIMIDGENINVLEFNVRFGDPETEVILPLLKTDLVGLCRAVIDGRLKDIKIEWEEASSVCVVIASGGYPGSYIKGKLISGLEEASAIKNVFVFHSGTKKKEGIVTDGGRVLGVTAVAANLKKAIELAYKGVETIKFDNIYYRKDIGFKGLKRSS